MAMVYELARRAANDVRVHWVGHTDALTFESLQAIAAAMGASVYRVGLDAGKSGFIIKYVGSRPRIYINKNEPKERQLFTLAHELGHLWERREVAGDEEYSFVDNRNGEKNLHEFFADEFAGALLLPEEIFANGDVADVDYIAELYGVSPAAVQERHRRLQVHPA